MANNYSRGATIVPSYCLAPGGAKRMVEIWQSFSAREDDLADWYYGLDLEAQSDGSLYLSSDEEWFSVDCFFELVKAAAEVDLIVKSFDISVAYTCDKLRPEVFGGAYFRALPDGEVLCVSTAWLKHRSDDQLRAIHSVVRN